MQGFITNLHDIDKSSCVPYEMAKFTLQSSIHNDREVKASNAMV